MESKKAKVVEIESGVGVTRNWWAEMREDAGERIQSSSHKMNK